MRYGEKKWHRIVPFSRTPVALRTPALAEPSNLSVLYLSAHLANSACSSTYSNIEYAIKVRGS